MDTDRTPDAGDQKAVSTQCYRLSAEMPRHKELCPASEAHRTPSRGILTRKHTLCTSRLQEENEARKGKARTKRTAVTLWAEPEMKARE